LKIKKHTDDDELIEDENDSELYIEGKRIKRFVEDFTDDTIICRSILYYYTDCEVTEFFRSG
jgi:hypothetical protein